MCSSSEPGSVTAQNSRAFLRVFSQKYSVWERVSSVEPDFEDETNSVRWRSSFSSSARIAFGCVVSRTWNRSTSKLRRSTSGASDEPPIPQRTTSSPSSWRSSAKRAILPSPSCTCSGSSSQPSQCASSLPVHVVASRSQMPSMSASRFTCSGGDGLALGAHPVEQLLERVGELLHALLLERRHDVVVVDAHRGQLLVQQRLGLLEVVLDGVAAHLAVILEGPDRLLRHRVHRARPDQLLDVEDVPVRRVLRGSGSPQTALRQRTLHLERLPAPAAEDLLVVLVRDARVRDGELAAQGQCFLRADRLEPLVGLGVDPRDEEARDRPHLRRISAALDEALEPADIGFHRLLVHLQREEEGDVDAATVRDAVLDRL